MCVRVCVVVDGTQLGNNCDCITALLTADNVQRKSEYFLVKFLDAVYFRLLWPNFSLF